MEAQQVLANNPAAYIRLDIARRPHLSRDVLLLLTQDPDPGVHKVLERRESSEIDDDAWVPKL